MRRHLGRGWWMDALDYWFTNRILEPRASRLLLAATYGALATAGLLLADLPDDGGRSVLIHTGGWFMFCGGLLGIPFTVGGVWWLERVGILSMATGLLMYLSAIFVFGGSAVGTAVGVAFLLTLAQRWFLIRAFMSAPRIKAVIEE